MTDSMTDSMTDLMTDLPSYSDITQIQPTDMISIVDEMTPITLELIDDSDKTSVLQSHEIRNADELISRLNFIESTNKNVCVKYILSFNDTYQFTNLNCSEQMWVRSSKTSHAIKTYDLLKTFLTFKYKPTPLSQHDWRITFGYILENSNKLNVFWKTILSLKDTINLINLLTPYNSLFYPNTDKMFAFYIGIQMQGFSAENYIANCIANKCSNPVDISKVLSYYTKLIDINFKINSKILHIVDDLFPFGVQISDNNNKCINLNEVRNKDELVSRLKYLEANKNKKLLITFQPNINDYYESFDLKVDKRRPITLQYDDNSISKYELFKTFLMFRYQSIPITQAKCRITFGYIPANEKLQFVLTRVNMSFDDSIALMQSLVQYNKEFISDDNSVGNEMRFYIGLRILHEPSYITNKFSNPSNILDFLKFVSDDVKN